jgi:hypothetical protein
MSVPVEEILLKIDEHDVIIKTHSDILEQHTSQISDIKKHGHDTNRSILIMNENISLLNNQINQTLRETIRNTSLLDEVRERTRVLEEDSIGRRAEKIFMKRQRKSLSDWLTVGYKVITIFAFLTVSILALAGYAKPEALLRHLLT